MKNIEQRYSEAFEYAKKVFKEKTTSNDEKILLKSIFPELTKLSDEEIYKLLIDYVKSVYWREQSAISDKDLISFLESQKEKSKTLNLEKGKWYYCIKDFKHFTDLHPSYKDFPPTLFYQGEKYFCERDGFINEWEFDGDEAYEYFRKCTENLPVQNLKSLLIEFLCKEEQKSYKLERKEMIHNFILWLKNDESLLDKTDDEPKFKKGDWITDSTKIPWLVENIDMVLLEYKIRNNSNSLFSPSIKSVNTSYHKWTMKDAKYGDILTTKDNATFIFSGTCTTYGNPIAICGLCVGEEFIKASQPGIYSWTDADEVFPATYEQKTELFDKMHAAGYSWELGDDKEHYRLKKIDTENIKDKITINNYDIDICFENRVEDIINNEFSFMSYQLIADSLDYLTSVYQKKANTEKE